MEDIIYTVHDRPGLTYSPIKTAKLVEELRQLAIQSLNPLPHYQIFSDANDKVVVTARVKNATGTGQQLLAFTSAVLIQIPELSEHEREVLHTGLTVITPHLRRQGMLAQLFMHLIIHVYSTRQPNSRLWITSLAEVPNYLVHVAAFFSDVFPSPVKSVPSETDLLIARTIDREHRDKLLIPPSAVLDETDFVWRGSTGKDSGPGKVFAKNVDDPQFWHRNKVMNDFHRELLKGGGDEVFQVGYMDGKKIAAGLKALGIRANL